MSEVQLLGCTCFRLLSMWHDMRQEVHVEMTWSEITAYLVSPARTHGISWHGTTFIAIRKLLANPSNRHLVAVLKVTMLASNSARCIWRSTSGLVHGIRSHWFLLGWFKGNNGFYKSNMEVFCKCSVQLGSLHMFFCDSFLTFKLAPK